MGISHYTKFKHRVYHENDILAFDIETSSLFKINNKWQSFDYSKDNDFYKNVEKYSYCYLWAFSYNQKVYYGRSIKEFKNVLEILKGDCKKIIWVHNLPFEFQFLRNITNNITVFSRKPHKVIKCFLTDYNIEFRCTYALSNVSLKKLAETYKLQHNKKIGDLDYNLSRNSLTSISTNELTYQEYDVLVIYDFISLLLKEYKTCNDIPLTQTGRVRREVKRLLLKDKKYLFDLKDMYPSDLVTFRNLIRAFAGGYTHANLWHSNKIIRNVFSYDIASSYPAVMLMCKFPMTKFIKCDSENLNKINFNHKAALIDIIFYGIKSKKYNNYISLSKCYDSCGEDLDNGRVIASKRLSMVVTEIDYQIILSNYEFESYEVKELWVSEKKFLPKTFTDYIIKLYKDKTKLKGIESEHTLYARVKEYINALYGMCVTNIIKDEIIFSNNEWTVKPLTLEEIEKQLAEGVKKNKFFLNYAWGVWITAYARQRLWEVINIIDYDLVYTDTDSLKFINENNKIVINEINEKWLKDLYNSRYKWEDIAPKDIKGIEHPIGVFEYEEEYIKFVTMGAKKYAYESYNKQNKLELHVTVSGVPKSNSAKVLGKIENFRDGFVFGYDCGKLELYYMDNQPEIEFTDYQGNTQKVSDRYGICMKPTTYKLSLTSQYEDVLEFIESQPSINLSVLSRFQNLNMYNFMR